ncbi:MAG: winged helix-turn-helix transcriptional regulator [Dehalococcoidia bacterium]|nr:MAG: winged helix-turn-helix transcriptional regulator [Dehalococcoidia bacterium]
MKLNRLETRLLDLVQAEFPLSGEPYAELGRRLGISQDEVIEHIKKLEAAGIVREIGPVLDSRCLGYQTTLVVMKISQDYLDKASKIINEHPGISHGYEREHQLNLWFTLSLPPQADLEAEVQRLSQAIGAEAVFSLPVLKQFKIGTHLGGGTLPSPVELSAIERRVINELQQDLPLTSAPFGQMAARLNMGVAEFLARCQSLLQRGVMRRFGASVNHREVGFRANAMACWVAPPEMVDAAAQKLVNLGEVSHCYERKTNPLWQYNLFAMIHGHTREACQEVAERVSRETGLEDYVLLFSTREIKKKRVRYLV